MMNTRAIAATILALSAAACSNSGSTTGGGTTTDSSKSVFPVGLAVTSPTANTTASAARLDRDVAGLMATAVSVTDDFTTKVAAFTTVASGTTAATCQVTLPQLNFVRDSVACYGPQLDYVGHPDGTPADGQLPAQDLGLWEETEGGTQACASAKLNGLVNTVGLKADFTMMMAASMSCTINVAGTALPAIGAFTDVTTDLGTAISAANVGTNVSSAKLYRLDDVDGNAVYKYEIVANTPVSGGTADVTMYMKHMTTATDGSTYKGKIWTQLSGLPGTTPGYAFSLIYEKTSTHINYQLTAANYPASATSIFDSAGNVAVDGDWNSEMSNGIFNIESSTGLGSVSYAWQAGSGDSHSRVFNAYTENDGGRKGCGFFGYGDRFDNATTALPDNEISSFICNWAGPGNSHTGVSGKAQKQCMMMTASGIYLPTSSDLAYAPTNSCDMAEDELQFKLASESTYASPMPAIANELVTLATDTEYTTKYVAPTAPTDF